MTELANYLHGSFTFSSELALIRSYTEIEKMRFEDKIRIDYDIAVEAESVKIPPLLIQPLVEDVIRHGIGSREDGGTIRRTTECCIIEVEDDGVGMTQARVAEVTAIETFEPNPFWSGVGLKNISGG